jgi:phenylpropionate dioxygenase-like ring-hydroxylating dioxygenase large terminal subunit
MLTNEENALLTRTGPGTPGGDLLRRYWQPVALIEELPVGGAPLPVRLLGEDLVLFRDDGGQPGLLGIHCAHRGADLSYGRLEDGGLRCIYHGWLYDVTGRCLEQPGEPVGSTFHERIRQTAYPCVERAGMILAYLGPGEPPLIPDYEFLTAPDGYVYTSKLYHECNYHQANEGNLDPTHLGYLHRVFRDGEITSIGAQAEDRAPRLEVEDTRWGVSTYSMRQMEDDQRYVRVNSFILPNLSAFPVSGRKDGYNVHWHVPIDDTSHWRYELYFQRERPVDVERMRNVAERTPDYHSERNTANRFRQDRDEMRTLTFSGLGKNFAAQDLCAVQGAGAIQDRTRENLGYSDRGLVMVRRSLLRAIRDLQAGTEPANVVRTPEANDFRDLVIKDGLIPMSADWRAYYDPDRQVFATP